MPKGIKKRGKIMLIIAASLIILLASPIILLRISKVQEFIIQKVTIALEHKLDTDIEIGGIKFQPFNKLYLEDIYIADQKGDTLVYSKSLRVNISILPLFRREIKLYEGSLEQPKIHIVTYADGKNNIEFVFNAFKSKKDNDPFELDLQKVALYDSQISYLDLRGDTTLKKDIFNSKNIDINKLDLIVQFAKDRNALEGKIETLSFKERSGFTLSLLTTSFSMNDTLFEMPSLKIKTPRSNIRIKDIWVSYDSLKSLNIQLPNLGVNLVWLPSSIYLPDFKYFVPTLSNFTSLASLEGKISGKVNNLKLSEMVAIMGNGLSLNGNLDFNGLPNLKDAFIFGSINSLTFNKNAIQDLIANFSKKPVIIPSELNNLGECVYKGNITGFIDNLVLYGKLRTDIGTISTDISLQSVDSFNQVLVKGDINSSVLHLGQLFPKSGLGNATFNISTELETGKSTPFMIKALVQIPSFNYNNYTYKDININGQFEGKEFIGKAVIDDNNGYFDFEGQINLEKKYREFKFNSQIINLNLNKLHLVKNYPDLVINANIHSNFEGDKIENMIGQILIDSLRLDNLNDSFIVNHFQMVASDSDNYQVEVISDILNGKIQGSYALSGIVNSARKLLSKYLPVFADPEIQLNPQKSNDIEFSLQLEPIQSLCEILNIPWYTTKQSTIYGIYNDVKQIMNFEIAIPELSNGKQDINGIYLYCNNTEELSIQLRANTTIKGDTLYAQLDIDGQNDTITSLLQWDNHNEKNLFAGEFLSHTHLYRVNDSLNATMQIEHTEFEFMNKPWIIHNSSIHTNFKSVDINDLHIYNKDQNIAINGTISDQPTDSIIINLLNINLDYISDLIPKMTTIKFGGDVTGYAIVASALNQPQINADIVAQRFTFDNGYLGTAYVNSHFDLIDKSIVFNGTVLNDNLDTTAIINGNYFVAKDSLDILGKADNLSLAFLNFYLGSIFDDLQGYGTGDIHIYGITKSKNIAIDADAFIQNAKITVGFLKTSYYFSDSIHMDKYGINFNNIEISDSEGNKGKLNGDISFYYLKDMKFNIDIMPNKMMVLNTTKQDFSNFYGKAYASGLVKIMGTEKDMRISCHATTEPGTKIYIPIDSYYASDNSFITFVSPLDSFKTTYKEQTPKQEEKPNTNLFIDLMLDVNTNAEVQLQIDSKAGDMIRGTGNGNLKITFDMLTSSLKMYGSYQIEKGEYLFTFQNVIRKYFHVKEGSTLSWTGNPLEPTIDINAYYQLSASLVDILDDATLNNAARSSVAVQCLLNLSGNLMQPSIKFDINLPNSDEDLNRALKNAISTDEQMNRQIIGLLLLGKFIDPESYQNAATFISGNELFSVVSSTLSSQLNSWASQLFENWNFGVNFRTSGEGDTRSNEYELNFLYTPNNRIVINGNVGYRDDNLSSTKFIGDFDIEYKLNQSGKLRAKAYTHTNDYKEFKKGLTTQGVGIVYRETFNTLPELWQSWKDAIKTSKQERAIRRTEKKEAKKAAKEKKQANKEK